MATTSIEWTANPDGSPGKTWNPVRGCSRTSPGCQKCYAESIGARFSGPGLPFYGFAEMHHGKPRWTGKVELVHERLGDPGKWRKPTRVFVNSMSDLFHEDLPDTDRDFVFWEMSRCPQHTFQILTKRADILYRYMSENDPLPNVWLGVSVENQQYGNERIQWLQKTPAAIRFLSCEPLLGPVQVEDWTGIHWCIVGGESGRNVRPMQIEWARSLKEQCAANGVRFFMKQVTERGRKIDFEMFPQDLQVRQFPAEVSA